MDTSSLTKETNVMSQTDLDKLREKYSFPSRVQLRILGEGKTILSACQGDVAFYEAAFLAGLRLPIHPTIRRILNHYKICPAQLSPNAWRSVICSLVIWRISNATCPAMNSGAYTPSSHYQIQDEVLGKIEPRDYFDMSKVLGSKTFKKHFAVGRMEISSSGKDNTTSGDEAMPARISLSAPIQKAGKKAATKDARIKATPQPPSKGVVIQEKWTSLPPGDDLDSRVSMMSSAHVARKVLDEAVPFADKEKAEQFSSENLVTKSFHALGQAVVLVSSLTLRSQEHQNDIDFQITRANSAELELAAKSNAESGKLKVVARLEAEVAELTSKLVQAKELAIEELKSLEDFKVVVTDSAATYFSEGFAFYKRKLLHQFPNLGIDVVNMDMDAGFAEEEEMTKEGEKEASNEGEVNRAP
ncbi:hypothetical protein Acr_00g0090210 [Actinidia rufa]|uniref:Transposase (putative) gypsy type domain-containing protein n=1 Tax=Actinidia rufa TaxID=165716 RepID=A0A7J0DY24_9ERIC|nr:hypothetical protein Acr_00g0090210 [Actinidia rufa]